jgi:hypothetical protein
MQLLRCSTHIIATLALGISFNVFADSWNCSSSDLVREVIVEYPSGSPVPCNVVYKKQTEGVEDQVAWSAENEEGFCEEKARELVANLESSGWVCMETVSPEAEFASGQAADTEQAAETEQSVDTEQASDSDQTSDTEQTQDPEQAADTEQSEAME